MKSHSSRLTAELDNGTDASRWAPLIGEMMICFGLMEECVNELIQQSTTTAVAEFARPLPLNQRTSLLRRLTQERKLSKANREAILANLDELDLLARHRNLVAHNPLLLDELRSQANWLNDRERIRSHRNKRDVAFSELSALTERVIRLTVALQQNAIAFDVNRLERGIAKMKGKKPGAPRRLQRAVPE